VKAPDPAPSGASKDHFIVPRHHCPRNVRLASMTLSTISVVAIFLDLNSMSSKSLMPMIPKFNM
jgi:hypothetical protein